MPISTINQNGLTNPLTSLASNTVGSASGSALTLQSNGGTTAVTINTSQNVGIGTTSPSGRLDVTSSYGSSLGTYNNTLSVTSTATAGVGVGPAISFQGNTGNSTAVYGFAGIAGLKESASANNYAGALAFYTQNSGGAANYTEQMRITSAGQVNLTRPVGDDTQINFLQMQGGGTSGGAVDNLSILSRYTASVSTSAKPIFGGPPRGSIVVVTGYTGASYFSDILNCSSNSVTVISSQNSTGSPASRTYSIVSFLLNLQMGSGTYDVGVLLLGTQPRY